MTARIESRPLVKTDAPAERAARAALQIERLRAPFSLRCGALLIDYIVIATIVVFSTLIARGLGGGSRMAGDSAETAGLFIALAVALVDFIVLPAWRGQTIGKWATGLRIVRKDGEPLSPGRSLLRHLVGYSLSILTLGLGFILAVFSARGRALHDIVAGTIVLRDVRRGARAS
jgi:uncharacterized RDD family membrane protein YckC